MNTKLLYIILLVSAGAAISCSILTSVYGTTPGTLTKILVSPSNNIAAVGDQFVFNFTGASSTPVKFIYIHMPANTTVSYANTLVSSQGIPSTISVKWVNNTGSLTNDPEVSLTLSSAVNLQNVHVVLFIAKFSNPPPLPGGGPQTVYITTTAANTNATIDTGSGTYFPKVYTTPSVTDTGIFTTSTGGYYPLAGNVGIGTTTPSQRLTVAGNINLTGSGTSKIVSPNNICIGAC